MRTLPFAMILMLMFSFSWGPGANPVAGQGPRPSQDDARTGLVVGITAGAGAVDNKRLFDAWTFGPAFGGRIEWARRAWAATLKVDVQPFRADRTDRIGDFRAVYILPTYSAGPPGRQLGLSLGMGVFDLTEEGGEESREMGFVAGLSASTRIYRSLSAELGWKRVNNVAGLKGSFYSLQLVQSWGF